MKGIRQNTPNSPIFELQTMLRRLTPQRQLACDGIFGAETQCAVSEFQRAADLPVTGTVDEETWNAIREAYRQALITKGPAEPLLIVLQPEQVLERGSENLHVYLVQTLLFVLGSLYPEAPRLRITGTLDAPTSAAVEWLQALSGLPETGAVDKHTWRMLARQYRLAVGDGSGTYPVRIAQRNGTPSE